MKFCKECGSSLEKGLQFCPECGTPTSEEGKPTAEVINNNSPANSSPPLPRKPFSKKQKLSAILGLTVALLLFIGFQVGASITDKDRKIEKFGEAVLAGDSTRVMNMLHSDDPRLEISEEQVENLLTYINNHPSYYTSMIESLHAQSQYMDKDHENDEMYDYVFSESIFHLQHSGKTALIFNRFDFTVLPFYIQIETNYSDAVISIDDEEIAVADSDEYYLEYGPIMPGVYQLKSEYSNEYTLLESSTELELISPYSSSTYADLSLSGDYITVYSDYSDIAKDSTLFINGEQVDFNLNDRVGPLSIDGELSIYAMLHYPWGDLKTEETEIHGNVNLEVDSPFTDELKDEFSDAIFNHAHDWAEAYSTQDESHFSNVTDHFLDYVLNDFSRMEQNDRIWDGEFVKAVFDLDSYNLTTNYDGQYIATVHSSLYYDSATVSNATEEYETELSENKWKYYLLYDEDTNEWLVDDYSSLYFVDHDHSKELVAKNDD